MITHITIKNFKSIEHVEMELGPLTVLAGQNASGKSNFVDMFHFVSDAMQIGLERAIMDRGGIQAIRRTSGRRPRNVKVGFLFNFGDQRGEYQFELAGRRVGEYEVKTEICQLGGHSLVIQSGTMSHPVNGAEYPPTKLGLTVHGVVGPLHPIRSYLSDAHFYMLYPNVLRELKKPTFDTDLFGDGWNLPSVLRRISKDAPGSFRTIIENLKAAVPGLDGVAVEVIGGYLVVKLRYGDREFSLSQESDGTIRLLALLTALYQDAAPPLIAIEEPELNIHPGALAVLSDAIQDASTRSQVIVTTHSPDLISRFDPDVVRVVERIGGNTHVGRIDPTQVDAITRRLFSIGDLMVIEGLKTRQN